MSGRLRSPPPRASGRTGGVGRAISPSSLNPSSLNSYKDVAVKNLPVFDISTYGSVRRATFRRITAPGSCSIRAVAVKRRRRSSRVRSPQPSVPTDHRHLRGPPPDPRRPLNQSANETSRSLTTAFNT
jgi:hypothetical protein